MSRHFYSRNVGLPLKDSDSLPACMPIKSVYQSCQKLIVSEYTAHDILVLTLIQGMMRDCRDEQALHVHYAVSKHVCSPWQW